MAHSEFVFFLQMMMAHLYCGGAKCLEVSIGDLLEV